MIELAKKLAQREDVVYLDAETTGTGPDDEIVQIAVVDHSGKEVFVSLVRPVVTPISPGATKVHGITTLDVAGAPTLRDIFADLSHVLIDRVVVGYNAEFDRRLLRQSCKNNGLDSQRSLPPMQWVDIMKPYAEYYDGERARWQSLSDACRQQGIPVTRSHDATEDCRLLYKLVTTIARKRRLSPTELLK